MTTQSAVGVHWHAYAERRVLHDASRKLGGSDQRVTQTPHAVLTAPEDVAAWLTGQAALFLRQADTDGQRWNALSGAGSRASLLKSVAAQGKSAYESVRVDAGAVVDLCAEVVTAGQCACEQGVRAESACPKSPNGHAFKKNAKGEWRCTHCGELM